MSDKPTGLLTTQAITKEALKILEQQLLNEVRYYKVRGLGGKWYIVKGYSGGPSVKGGLTEAEADAFLKLLKEQ
jgi:hypothetical protein